MIQMDMRSVFVAMVVLSDTLGAQVPTVSVSPAEPAPGSIIRLMVATPPADDSIVSIRGMMAGEPLRFLAGDSARYHAIGGIPADASDNVTARVFVARASGRVDSLSVGVPVPKVEPSKRETTLSVDTRFTRPMDAKTQARIARENALALSIGRAAHKSAPMWTDGFRKPRESRITSQFGTGRMFNGTMASRHLGVDYQGAPGAPVYAANRGVVALVDTFFLAGRVVYIDHGGGVVTGYFHLTTPLVAKGDTVERGQRIGTVGATGRVTGPHLHWSARYGAITVNPGDLLEIPPAVYGKRE
ncbi:MAG TPA: M23 family metallopeptidase [Gemmatimonadaceae bacterium]|nr:M23 family metallopeptidase [Gemmatimonadaceae bacterium]